MWTFLGVGVSFGLVLTIASGALIDVNSTRYSVACRETDVSCSYNRSNDCTFLKANATRECYVRIGFCTEKEFANLTSEICNENRTGEPDSEAKSNFYKVFANVSANCRKQGAYCIYSSVLSIVFKQQEKYCFLMNVNTTNGTSETCLTNGDTNCTLQEFRDLNDTACKVNPTNSPFADALWNTSATCKGKISFCANTSLDATQLVKDERYCDSVNMNGAAENCFKPECTGEEISRLKTAACGADVTSTTQVTTVTTHNAATTQTWDIFVKILLLSLMFFLITTYVEELII